MPISRGQQLADFLHSAWRREPADIATDEATLQNLLPLMLESGLGPLGWWRIRHSSLAKTAPGQRLHQDFYEYALGIMLQEQRIESVLIRLRAAGIEPVLIKGWASARLYPKRELRPLGDLDLLVPPAQLQPAKAALGLPDSAFPLIVDFKTEFPPLYEMDIRQIFANSRVVSLRQTTVRVLSPEDNLRLLCLHCMRHGAWRALWLCDIATVIESQKAELDWDRCLAGTRHCIDWTLCAIGLAHRLLGANIEGIPLAQQAQNIPQWMTQTVLKLWQTPFYYRIDQFPERKPMLQALQTSNELRQGLRDRWPNPVELAVASGGVPRSVLPILPRQLLLYSGTGLRFFRRMAHKHGGRSN